MQWIECDDKHHTDCRMRLSGFDVVKNELGVRIVSDNSTVMTYWHHSSNEKTKKEIMSGKKLKKMIYG